jgi:hypothetical protein
MDTTQIMDATLNITTTQIIVAIIGGVFSLLGTVIT